MSCDLDSWSEILPDQKSTGLEHRNKYKGWQKVESKAEDEWKMGDRRGSWQEMCSDSGSGGEGRNRSRRWQVTGSEVETVWGKGVPLTITPLPEKYQPNMKVTEIG